MTNELIANELITHNLLNDSLMLLVALLTGIALGLFFFGGLLWTVRKGITANRPGLWFLGSLFLRLSVTLTGFYLIADGHWPRLLLCLLGFILARTVVQWCSGLAQEKDRKIAIDTKENSSHAP